MLNNVLLVNLTLSCPSGVRKSREASNTVYRQYNCDAKSGHYNKNVWGDALDDIKALQARIRNYHDTHTFPWMDSGFRIITVTNAIEYYRTMGEFEGQLNTLIQEFLNRVSSYKQSIKLHLGDLYNESDYVKEEDLRKSIGMKITTMEVPGGDFRTELSDMEKDLIADKVKNSMENALQDSMKEAWERLKSAIKRISQGCSDEGRISRTMVTSLTDILSSLKGLNLTADPEIENVVEKATRDLTFYSSEVLMQDDGARQLVKDRADAILEKLRGW